MKTLAFFDVDRTIRRGSAALDYCHYLLSKGFIKDTFSVKDARVRKDYSLGKISYQEMVEGVVTIHASALSGLKTTVLADSLTDFISLSGGLFDWAEEVFALLRSLGIQTVLVSAGIRPAIEAVALHLQADIIFASEPEIVGGVYTGKVTRILHDEVKATLVKNYISHFNEKVNCVGFGDSTGDVSMLSLLDHAFIINPHQKEMLEIAQNHNWDLINDESKLLEKINGYLPSKA